MSILIDETTPVLVQGMTGDKGTFHAKEMIAYGTNVVGGVTPGKGGGSHLDRPLFNTMKEAVKETGATTSITFVAPAFCADAIMEAADAGVRLICSITDGIPAQDMMRVKRYMMRYPKDRRPMMVGPNCAGIIRPGKAMPGVLPGHIQLHAKVRIQTAAGLAGAAGAVWLLRTHIVGHFRAVRRKARGAKARDPESLTEPRVCRAVILRRRMPDRAQQGHSEAGETEARGGGHRGGQADSGGRCGG